MRVILLTLAILFAPSASAAGLTPRQRGDLAIQSRAILSKYCRECHGQAKRSFDVLDYSQLSDRSHPVPFVNIENPLRSQIIEFIEDGSMPPGGRDRPSASELAILKQWIGAKAPRYPRSFDDANTLAAIAADWPLQKIPGTIRYVSLAHRIAEGAAVQSLEADQFRLQQALDAATTKEKSFALQPVDEAATLFRIDVDKLGWAEKDLFEQVGSRGEPLGVLPGMIPFDLILLENPFALPKDARFDAFLGNAKHMRPVPFLRGDWLAESLAPGSPLAADMKSLVELAAAKEPPCGPKVRALEKSKTMLPAGANPPITAWYGPERKDQPFEVTFTLDGKETASLKVGEEFKLHLESEREAKFIVLNVLSDGTVRIQPVSGGTIVKKGEPRDLTTPTGKAFRCDSILSGANAAVEYYILIAAAESVPAPTFVRSTHNTFDCPKDTGPVWRYLFNVDEFDSTKAVRKVIQLNIGRK